MSTEPRSSPSNVNMSKAIKVLVRPIPALQEIIICLFDIQYRQPMNPAFKINLFSATTVKIKVLETFHFELEIFEEHNAFFNT